MASETDNFYSSGPKHLTDVKWDDANHRKSVAASLVNGVYVLEKDRQKHRKGSDSLACHWWEFFHFQLFDTIIDDVDNSIFGAIYKLPQPSMCNDESPHYVIAFRGTTIKPESFLRDMELDLEILKHGLHRTSRAKIATETVRNMVARVGDNGSKIWLAGHSLGSGIALLAGKTMAKSGIFIESFLFNPPFPSVPLDQIINNEKAKHRIRIFGSVVKTGVGIIAMNSDKRRSSRDSFSALSAWMPNLFVNPSDYICSEYVGYFEHRSKMDTHTSLLLCWIEKRATQISVGCEFMRVLGEKSEPLHLIPSAILTVNLTPQMNFIKAHGIDQWWKPNLRLKPEPHIYKY